MLRDERNDDDRFELTLPPNATHAATKVRDVGLLATGCVARPGLPFSAGDARARLAAIRACPAPRSLHADSSRPVVPASPRPAHRLVTSRPRAHARDRRDCWARCL